MDNQSINTDLQALEAKIKSVQMPAPLADKANSQIQRVLLSLKYGGSMNQIEIVSKYIDWITTLPWAKKTEDSLNITSAKTIMDKNHYGLEDIKKRILEYLSVLAIQKQKGNMNEFHAPVLFFVGLAGTGKTTFAKSVAETLGRAFIRIPFGGLSSAIDLRGLSKVNPEAEPGQIVKAIRRVGTCNPVVLLDELDRITPEAKGAIMGVLIELLDPEQNINFIDHYIDYPFDLSHIIFIATANNTNNISTAVMDRLEVIQMPSYTDKEKVIISKNYIFPRMVNETGLTSENITVEDSVWQKIARMSGYDPGLRSVERRIEGIIRRVAFKMINGEGNKFAISEANAKEYFEQF